MFVPNLENNIVLGTNRLLNKMFIIPHFRLFALAVLMINITPGATFLAVSSESVRKGLQAGLFTSVGACAGLMVYALLTSLGLAVLITGSPLVYSIIRFAGVGYLLYCSIKSFCQKPLNMDSIHTARAVGSFQKGLFVNLLNPLTPVLFLTLIPQFISGKSEAYPKQLLLMGLWICFSALTVNIIWAFLFSYFGKYFSLKPLFWKWQVFITGFLFLYLAIKFAFFL